MTYIFGIFVFRDYCMNDLKPESWLFPLLRYLSCIDFHAWMFWGKVGQVLGFRPVKKEGLGKLRISKNNVYFGGHVSRAKQRF